LTGTSSRRPASPQVQERGRRSNNGNSGPLLFRSQDEKKGALFFCFSFVCVGGGVGEVGYLYSTADTFLTRGGGFGFYIKPKTITRNLQGQQSRLNTDSTFEVCEKLKTDPYALSLGVALTFEAAALGLLSFGMALTVTYCVGRRQGLELAAC
jgi:hypothetical protein